MADRNDVNIKVGVSGAKKALDELTKVLDSYSKKEKAQQQLAYQADLNAIKLKGVNSERLHLQRMQKEQLRIKQVLNNAKIESDILTRQRDARIADANAEMRVAKAAADQATANAKVITENARATHAAQIQADKAAQSRARSEAIVAESMERQYQALLKTENEENKLAASASKRQREEARTAENAVNSMLRLSTEHTRLNERATQETTRRYILEAKLDAQLSQDAIKNDRLVADERRRQARADQLQRESDQRMEIKARRDAERTLRAEQIQADRASRIDRGNQGFFGGLLGPQIGGVIESLGRLNLAFMIAGQSVAPLVNAIAQGTRAFAEYQQTMMTLEVVTRNTGVQFSGAKRLIDEFNDGLSDEKSIAGAVRNFSSMGLSLKQQEELIRAMRNGIVAMGGDVSTQLPLMALAIKRNSSELLDNMGITKNVDEMYKEYAKSIGLTVKELNQQQKDTAVINGVLKELAQYNGIADKSLQGLNGQMAKAQVNANKLWVTFGNFISPAAEGVLDYFNRLAGAIVKATDNSEDLNKQLRYMPAAVAQQAGETESIKQLGERLKAVNQELAKNTQAGIRADAPIMDALRKRGDEIIKQIHTIERAEKLARERKEKSDKEAAERAAKQREKDAKQAEKDAKKRESEEERRRREAQKRMDEAAARMLREGALRSQTIARTIKSPTFGAFDARLSEAGPGASLEEQRAVAAQNMIKLRTAEGANIAQLNRVTAQQNITTVLPKEQIDRLKKDREAIEKAIKDGAKDISEYQQKLDEIDQKIKEEKIKNTADFLRNAFGVAYQLMQGDFATVAMNIGGMLGESIIKNLSEMDTVQTAIKPITEALVSGMEKAASAISGIITSLSAFLVTNPGVILLTGVAAGIGLLIANSIDVAKKKSEEFIARMKKQSEEIAALLPKNEPTLREQRQRKLAELEGNLPGLRQQLATAMQGFRGGGRGMGVQYDRALIARLQQEIGVTEQGIKDLGDILDNDLTDPMSEASIAAKKLADAIEKMRLQSEAYTKVADMNADLQDKIFNQTIDRMVAEGKISKEEGDRQKKEKEIQRDRDTMIEQAFEKAKPMLTGEGTFIEKSKFSAAFRRFAQGGESNIAAAATMLEQIGVRGSEADQILKLFENISKYITGRGADTNMPGSSPDKPVYTQVVNVRDFREAFPDSAYFRAPSVDTTRSLNANSVVYR
jgi:hypothetical protein